MGATGGAEDGRHQRNLRRLASVLAGVLLCSGLGLGAFSLWVWQVRPLKTAGVHGMLPEDFASWMLAAGMAVTAAMLIGSGLLAALARLRSLLGRAAALLLGVSGLWSGPYLLPFLTLRSGLGWWCCSLLSAAVSASLIALSVAAQLEVRRVEERPWVWLRRPLLVAAILATGALATRGARVFSLRQEHAHREQKDLERQAAYQERDAAAEARFHDCEKAGDWSAFCGGALGLGVSPNGQWLATLGKELMVWDVATGKRAWSAASDEQSTAAHAVHVSDDGQTVVVPVAGGQVLIADASSQRRSRLACGTNAGYGASVALSPNGRQGAIVAHRVCLFDLIDEETPTELPVQCSGGEASFTADGKALWLACMHTLRRVELATGKETLAIETVVEGPKQEGRSARPWYNSVRVSADGSRVLALWGHDGSGCSVDERDASSGAPLDTTQVPNCNRYSWARWLPPLVVVPDVMNNRFSVVDLERHAASTLTPPGEGARQVAASRDGKVVFVGKLNGNRHAPAPTVRRWDLKQ